MDKKIPFLFCFVVICMLVSMPVNALDWFEPFVSKDKKKTFTPYDQVKFFDFDELLEYAEDDNKDFQIDWKLRKLMRRAIGKQSPQVGPIKHSSKLDRDYIRVTQWNIERGLNIDSIEDIFKNPDKYLKNRTKDSLTTEPNADLLQTVKDEIETLKASDILILNEVDMGMHRTNYMNVADKMASLVDGGYVFATEFIELSPEYLSDHELDHDQYKGLHGNAIVSKYPILSSKVVRLKACYDWYKGEKKKLSIIEKGKRVSAKATTGEELITEVRLGSRVGIIADLQLPNEEVLTVAAVHLENRTPPKCRVKQMKQLLDKLEDKENPVILGGDFNSFDSDASPASVKKVLKKFSNPLSLAGGVSPATKTFKHRDPTVKNRPLLFPNKSRSLFLTIFDFEFDDDMGFDLSGDDEWTFAKVGNLSNSNERSKKGFVETFEVSNSFKLAKFKIDWLFVKPIMRDGEKSYFPAFGRTLKELNRSSKEGKLSDHSPVSLELMI